MGLIQLVPPWVFLTAAVAAWGAWGHYKANRYETSRLETALESQRLAARARAKDQQSLREVETAYARNLKSSRARISDLNAAYGRLLSGINSADPARDTAAICGVDGERGRTLERLLNESAELARTGAAEVERLGTKTTALQDYIRRVCLSQENAHRQD